MEENDGLSRRSFLTQAGSTIVSIGLPGVFVRLAAAEQRMLSAEIRQDGKPRLPPGQFAVEKINDMGGSPGTATDMNWRLRVHGEVERPVVLSFSELINLEQVQITCDVHCVTGWTLLNSKWRGVRLTTIMDMVKPRKTARFVVFEAAHGYTSNISASKVGKESVFLAHHFFDEKLPRAHGAPVRVLIPDLYFYKSAKWIEGVKFTFNDEPGFWETRGYSNSADPWKEERSQ
jgi:DMSO/TMAO reductase YedYZ molybdopterin-dependent catalytic subunit